MLNPRRTLRGILALALLGLLLVPYGAAAQIGTKTYEITVTNINTGKQGLSPLIIATHPAGVHAWQMGQLASKGTELLAEEGMTDMLASELKGQATDVVVTHAHLLPGDSITVRITANDGDVVSAETMLIQTNDGFTGLDNASLNIGSTDTMAYDAGTEDNSELKTDVPGPPFGGKNHGPDPSPKEPISMHPGIAGNADVTPDFKWSGPVAHFTIRAVAPSTVPITSPAAPIAAPTTAPLPETSGGVPGMPVTGAGDTGIWTLAVLAGALFLLGLLLRLSHAARRR